MKHQRHLTLFLPTGLLEFIAVGIIGTLPRTYNENQFDSIITDRYPTLTPAILTIKTSTLYVTTIIFHSRIIPYGIPSFLLTYNGLQFVGKLFENLCLSFKVRHLTTTAYHPQTNGQVERYNKTVVALLRHYICDHQKNWDEYIQPLTYAYNTPVHV